ncbi:MAG: methionine aminopeptidase [Dermatophilaceae bacterium]
MRYWYNVRSGQVEDDDNRSMAEDVMGPYDTPEDAARALETARKKSEKWDADEREWRNRGAAEGWDKGDSGD